MALDKVTYIGMIELLVKLFDKVTSSRAPSSKLAELGMILTNTELQGYDTYADVHVLPAFYVSSDNLNDTMNTQQDLVKSENDNHGSAADDRGQVRKRKRLPL